MKQNFATLFGLGYMPYSASIASLLAVGLYFLIELTFPPLYPHLAIILVTLAWAGATLFADKEFAITDPQEVVAMYVCLVIAGTLSVWVAALFVLFRVLDIWKPFPFDMIDKAGTWYSVLLDDLAIGIFLGVLYRILAIYLPL